MLKDLWLYSSFSKNGSWRKVSTTHSENPGKLLRCCKIMIKKNYVNVMCEFAKTCKRSQCNALKGVNLFYAAAKLHKPKGTGASGLRVGRKETHPQHFRGLCVCTSVNAFGHFPNDSTRGALQRRSVVLIFFGCQIINRRESPSQEKITYILTAGIVCCQCSGEEVIKGLQESFLSLKWNQSCFVRKKQ